LPRRAQAGKRSHLAAPDDRSAARVDDRPEPRCPRARTLGRRARLRRRRRHGRGVDRCARPGSHRHHEARQPVGDPGGAVPRADRAGRAHGGGMSPVERAETYPLPALRRRTALSPVRGTAFAYKWELLKLRAQKRTYLGLGASMIVPVAFVLALVFRSGGPTDITLGKYLRQSGLATPFVVLEFMSIWGLPLITALVAGDIVASESHNGTLKTILTRSRERGEVFAAKIMATATYTLVALVAMVVVAVVAGTIEFGWHPLISLSGTTVSPGRSLGLLFASAAVYAWPLRAIAAFGLLLSTATRN